MSDSNYEPLLDMFNFETTQLLEQLEQIIIRSEKSRCFGQDDINEIFRIMHTIKGSSAMMDFSNISTLAHSVEDLFYFLREDRPLNMDCSKLSDIVLDSIDFIKNETRNIVSGESSEGDVSILIDTIKSYLTTLKEINQKSESNEGEEYSAAKSEIQKKVFKAVVYFEEGCEMENLRAFAVIRSLKDITEDLYYIPEDIEENNECVEVIRKEGFQIWLKTDRSFEEMHNFFSRTIFLKYLELVELDSDEQIHRFNRKQQIIAENVGLNPMEAQNTEKEQASSYQSIISVNVKKLDKLMDIVGELVISEAMITQNPDIAGLELDNFQKAARQHRKIINELQDIAMSIRMVPLSTTFHRMNRIIRDMCKSLNKDVRLEIIGEETEVDKNIIEHISDPLMHLIRNSIDHGIESAEERRKKGKTETGTITLEAKNEGSDVLIIVKDDGKGLNKEKILAKARENGLINRPENDLTEREIYSYIFVPGFSTNDEVTKFSGRGVGMDVVVKNISSVGGKVLVDSVPDEGTIITVKIPLTLAIMDGMIISVGKSIFTVPIINIRESFKGNESDVFTDPDGNEMIMIRGECYPILRLHELYRIETEITNISDGIMIMVENEGKSLCIFVDRLVGEQQVVVKALPEYIKNFKKVRGLVGCTLLGDGSISLILNIADLFIKK